MFTSGAFGYLADYLLWLLAFASLLLHTSCFFRFFPRKRLRKTGLIVGNALVFACMLAVVALAAETYLRFLSVATDPFGTTLPARRWFAMYTTLNSQGCRDKEWTPQKPPGTRRIAFVGDSFTYGWGIERVEDRYSDRVGRRFEGGGVGAVEVMNVAQPGWDTGDQLQPITDMIEYYDVDEVILCYVLNDIERLLPTTESFNPSEPPQSRFVNTDASALAEHLYYRLVASRAPSVRKFNDWLAAGYAQDTIWAMQRDRLSAIMTTCRERGVVLRVVLLPFLRTGGGSLDPPAVHSQLSEFLRASGLDVLDLLPLVADRDPSQLTVSPRDAHPGEPAQEIFADAIWQAFYAEADSE